MNSPRISIIIPVYNVENYIVHCLDSILSQTFTDFELLLIDDGSTDHSGHICDEYAGKDNRVLVSHKPNGGVSTARNAGIRQARGEYLCFIDPDDWVEPCYLETLVKEADHYDIVYFGFVCEYSDGYSQSYPGLSACADDTASKESCMRHMKVNDMGDNLFGFTWNKMFRRDLIQKSGLLFLENVHLGEDELFTLAYCLQARSLKVIPDVLYHYRQRPDSLIRQKEKSQSARIKFHEIERLLPLMKTAALQLVWTRCAYHTLEEVAKRSSNVGTFLHYHLKAFLYKRRHAKNKRKGGLHLF